MPEKNLQNRRVGYACVSTYGQTLAAQLEQLRKAGCTQIYREKATAHGPIGGNCCGSFGPSAPAM